ncbi:MAG: LamG-like jellyroll fold domain-containing protein [Nanoarchaeota archaeon]
MGKSARFRKGKFLIKNRKGYFFSADAFIALLLILGVVLFIKPVQKNTHFESNIDADLINVLSDLKIGDINNVYVKQLIASGNITNINQSVLDQIGEFYAQSSPLAGLLAQNILDNLSIQENIALYLDNQLIASKSSVPYSNASKIFTSRQIISGINNASGAATGYSSKAYLSSKSFTEYSYFGGYIGDGNLSSTIYRDASQGILGVSMEGAFSGNFSVSINNNFISYYTPTSNVPFKIDLTPFISYLNDPAIFYNNITFRSSNGSNLYIAGGYIKTVYDKSFPLPGSINYIPGVKGLINIYSSFYIPGALSALNVYLKYNSSYDVFMTIGNKEIYRGNSSGSPTTVFIDNSVLSTLLNYTNLSKKTIPFRIGLDNVSYTNNQTTNVDAISVSDLSGSMGGNPMTQSKQANIALINGILNSSGNKIGLVGFEDTARITDFHNISNYTNSLQVVVNNSWDAAGHTCICCGINKAVAEFLGDRLIDYYTLNGDSLDKSGYSHTANLINGPTYASGINGSALSFNGNNQYLNAFGVPEVTEGGTISFWFKLNRPFNSSVTTTQGLWSKYVDSSNNAFIALKGTDMLNPPSPGARGSIQAKIEGPYQSGTHNTVYVSTAMTSWQNNTWYHIALTWDETGLKIYVNGFLNGSTATSAGIGYTSGDNYFGRSRVPNEDMNNPRDKYLNGSMDEIRMYNYALNQTSIRGLVVNPAVCGNNVTEVGEVCEVNVSRRCSISGKMGIQFCNNQCSGFDVCMQESNNRFRTMIVMTDGVANRNCPLQGVTPDLNGNGVSDDLGGDDAVQAACDAFNNYSIRTYSVAFGSGADTNTTNAIASCGMGNAYVGDVNNIISIYTNISQQIIQAAYSEQTVVGVGNISTELYPDSYIVASYNYAVPSGLLITSETPIFGNNVSNGTLYIPNDTQIYSARVVSYSGSKWTSVVDIYNSTSGAYDKVFDLSDYNSSFISLGDPYAIDIPPSKLVYGNNTVRVRLGVGSQAFSSGDGSIYDKIIYTLVKNVSSYSPILSSAQGCLWEIEFEDSTVSTINAPQNYSGSNRCYYNSSISGNHAQFNPNDAVNYAVYLLLVQIDLNLNGKIESKITEQDLAVDSNTISGIPFAWETEVQSRVWY